MSVVRRNIYSALVSASSLVAGAGVLVCGSQPAFAQARYDFTVPRGDLATVVTQIGRTAGTIIVIPQSLAAGRMAGPVQGRETVFDALAKALAGTGLRADSGQGRSIIIRAASSTSAIPPAGANVIEAIDVTDNSGVNAFGDRGFQAGAAGETVRIGGAPIKEIPLSVSVVTRDVVRSQGITSTADAVRNVAGVSASAVSTGRPEFTIRGFKQAGYAINGQIGSTFAQVPIDGVERIEVLKGPTSILTGVSREGGVVNVTLKEPTAEPIRTLTMRYGTYNYKTLAADFGGPAEGVDGLNYRFVASGNHADENYGGYRHPRELHIAPSVRWTGADLSILLGMRYDRAHLVPAPATFAPFLLEGGLGRPLRLPREVPIGSPYFGGSTEEIAFHTRQSYDVGNVLGADVTVNNSTQYLISRAKLLTGLLDATEDEVQGLFNSASNVSMRDLTNRLDVTTEYNAGFARNFLKLGYDYIDRTSRPRIGGESLGNVNIRTGLPYFPLRFAYSPDLREDSSTIQGIYFIDKLDTLDDRLHIMGSYRYDWQATNSVTRSPLETTRASVRNEGESWVAGAAFDVTSWMTVYGNRSVGFVPSVLGTVAGALPAPEGRDLAEVGARYFLFDKRLSLTTSLFDLARTNVTIPDPRDPTGQTRILVGGLRSRGTEFELQGEILPGLNVIASLAIQNIAVTDRATEEGGEFFGVPKKTASLWVTYAPQSTPFAGLTFGVGGRGNSRSTTGIGTDSVYVPGYVVADAMVAYQRDDFSVSLNVKNILNEYSLSPSYFNYYIGINQGRSALLQADYRF